MPDYFVVSGDPATGSSLSSSVLRAEITAIAAGFAKVAGYSSAANRVVHINAGATAQTTTSGFTFDGTTLVAPALTVTNNATVTGDLAVNGGDLTSTASTFNLLAANAVTVNAFGAASTALNIGHASAAAAFPGGISIPTGKNVTGTGTATVTGFATVSATTLTGTLSTAAQPNVTSVGTLLGLTVTAAPTFSAMTATRVLFAGIAGLLSDASTLTFNSGTGALSATNFVGTFAGNTFTTGTGVLTIAAGKTLTASSTITFTATDGSTLAIGTGGTLGTAAYTASTAYEASGGIATHAALTATHGVSGAIVGTTDAQELSAKTLNASVAKGTWTASGTWTLPAFTLGGSISGGGQTVTNLASVAVRDTSAAYDVTLAAVSSAALTAGRTLTLDMQNAAQTLKFGTAGTKTFPDGSVTLLASGGALGTPSSGTLTNATGLPIAGITGLGAGVATWLATPTTLPAGTTGSSLTSLGTIAALVAGSLTMNSYSAGTWTTPAFSAGDFTGSGSMTWTVSAGNVATYSYTIINKLMTVNFVINQTDVGGTPDTFLQLAIPAGKTATKTVRSGAFGIDNSTNKAAWAQVSASGTTIGVRLLTGNWAATGGAADTYVYGSITFEIN